MHKCPVCGLVHVAPSLEVVDGQIMQSAEPPGSVMQSDLPVERCSFCGEPMSGPGEYGLGHGWGRCYDPGEHAEIEALKRKLELT